MHASEVKEKVTCYYMHGKNVNKAQVPVQIKNYKISFFRRKYFIHYGVYPCIDHRHCKGINNCFRLQRVPVVIQQKSYNEVSNRRMVKRSDEKQQEKIIILFLNYKNKPDYNYQQHAEIHIKKLSVHNNKIPDHRVNYERCKPAVMCPALKVLIKKKIKH